jgi:hypothetical protein
VWARKGGCGSGSSLTHPLVKYKWGEEQQKAFDEIKQKVSKETLLIFPDFEKEFHVYTDVFNKQLGAVIMQEGTAGFL